MSTSYMGLGAGRTRVSTHREGEYIADDAEMPVESEAAIVLEDPGNCAHVTIGGTKEELRQMIDDMQAQFERLEQ